MSFKRIFDSHAHYDDEKFEGKAIEILKKLYLEEDVRLVLNAGAGIESTKKAAELSSRLDFVYFSSGIHPENAVTDGMSDNWREKIKYYAAMDKCKAIGEIGLDYYYGKDTADMQKKIFTEQLEIACETGLPVIIHDREAHADCIDILSKFPGIKAVFHSYSGSFEMAKELMKRGYYISFNGIVTFKNARKTVEVAEGLREYECGRYLSRILVETDCPYLAPVPVRGSVNHSGNIKYIAARMAEILNIPEEDFCELTYRNACDFYGLDCKGDKV